MANTILITANWHTGALSQQTISRQYDNNRYVVQFVGYPEMSDDNELDYYLLVWMSSAPGETPDEIAPIQLASDQWYISNVFTQQTQQIKFQMCALNTDGTFEAHSPIFTGFVRNSLEHDGTAQDIDVSTLFDAYREYLNELIIRAGAVVIDPTLSQSGQAADAYAVGNEFNRITATTKNLWFDASTIDIPNTTQKGIVSFDGYIQFLLYKPLPAGTYTLSCELESDFSATTYCKMRFSASQNVNAVGSFIGDVNIEIGTGRKKYTFTLTQTAYSVRVFAGTTTSNAAGHTAVWKNIQIEVGNKATYYIPAVTARDFFAVHSLETFINASNIADTYGDANDLPPNSIVGVSGAAGMLNYPPTTASCEIITLAHTQKYGIVQVAIPMNGELDGKIYHRGNPSGEYTAWVSSAKDIFETNDVEVYADFQDGYIDTSGNVINPTPVSADRFYSKIIICSEGDEYLIEACGGNASRLQYTICDASYNVLIKGVTMSEANGAVIAYNPWNYKVTIPAGGAFLIVNHHHLDNNSYVTPRVYRLSNDSIKNYIATYMDGTLPYRYEAWKRYVVATYESMIVILRSGKFRLSTDCGKTWNTGVDVSGISGIQRAYLFANGNLAFYTDTKAYYIDDWKSYNEADCYEQNGSQFVPSPSTNFFNYWIHKERKFVNGRDMYVFGTYKLVPGERVLIWYTLDYGKTYKVAYEFNIEGSYSIRHVHEVLYYEPEDKFIVTTGDSNATECMVFLFEYDVENDTWTHTLVGGPARNYKWANMAIWNDEIYYCNDNTPGSVWKFKFEDIGDLSKHTCVLENTYCDPFSVNFGNMGDMLVTQSHVRNTAGIDVPIPFDPHCATRVMYYSSDRKHFSEVIIPIQMIKGETYLSNFLPVTSDGHLICGIFAGTSKLPSVYVDEFIRIAGFKQAFSSKF